MTNRGPELFQRFNVHTEIKLILILILILILTVLDAQLSKADARVDINYNTAEGKQSLSAHLRGSLSYVTCDVDPNQELILFHLPTGELPARCAERSPVRKSFAQCVFCI